MSLPWRRHEESVPAGRVRGGRAIAGYRVPRVAQGVLFTKTVLQFGH